MDTCLFCSVCLGRLFFILLFWDACTFVLVKSLRVYAGYFRVLIVEILHKILFFHSVLYLHLLNIWVVSVFRCVIDRKFLIWKSHIHILIDTSFIIIGPFLSHLHSSVQLGQMIFHLLNNLHFLSTFILTKLFHWGFTA